MPESHIADVVAIVAVERVIIVIVGVAIVAQAVGVKVQAVVADATTGTIGTSDRAVIASVCIGVFTHHWIEWCAIDSVGHAVVVIIGVAIVAQAVGVKVQAVAADATTGAIGTSDCAVIASVGIGVFAHQWIEWCAIDSVGHAVVIIVGVAGVTQAVAVSVHTVIADATAGVVSTSDCAVIAE